MITKKSLKTYNGAYYTHILAGVLSPRFPDQSDLTQRNMCKGPYFISVLTLSLALTFKSLSRGPYPCFTRQSPGIFNHGHLNSWPLCPQPPNADSPAQY